MSAPGRSDCCICRGSGEIRLPVYSPLPVTPPSSDAIVLEDILIRTFPCPECSEYVPIERLYVMRSETDAHAGSGDPEYAAYVERDAASLFVRELVRKGFVRFEKYPQTAADRARGVYRTRATLGVVSTKRVASLEDRINARQMEVTAIVAAEAKRRIAVWGADYSGHEGPISKAMACRAIDEALNARFQEAPKP